MRDLILDPYLRNAFLNVLMDGTLLWAAAAMVKQRARGRRLIAGAVLGGLYTFWLLLARDGFLPGWTWLSSPSIVLLLLPTLMLTAAFAPLGWRRFLQLGMAFVFLSLLTWGLANVVFYQLTLRGHAFSPLLCVLLEIGAALVVAEVGWGAVHRQAVARVCQVPVTFVLGEVVLEIEGYLDTGNHLHDPVTRKPVVVLDYAVVRSFLTPAARAFIEAVAEGGNLPPVPVDDPWLARLRLIPYRSVQRRSGLMPGLRADEVRLGRGERSVSHRSVVLGLELAGGLGKDGCRALVPPVLWSWLPASLPRREGM